MNNIKTIDNIINKKCLIFKIIYLLVIINDTEELKRILLHLNLANGRKKVLTHLTRT